MVNNKFLQACDLMQGQLKRLAYCQGIDMKITNAKWLIRSLFTILAGTTALQLPAYAVEVPAVAVYGQAYSVAVPGQGTWESDLKARDINGNPLTSLDDPSAAFYYDVALNITWLRDWNAGAGSAFDDGGSTSDGKMSVVSAEAWANSLAPGGFTGWHIPGIIRTDPPGCAYALSGTDCGFNVLTSGSAIAHMFYVTLGNLGMFGPTGELLPTGWGLSNTAQFTNIHADDYWADTFEWQFNFWRGQQGPSAWPEAYAVAVRAGDVSAVPEPARFLLLISGLGMLGVVVSWQRGGLCREG